MTVSTNGRVQRDPKQPPPIAAEEAKKPQPPPARSYEERLAELDKNEVSARVTNNKQALFNIHKAREELKKEFGKGGRYKKSRKTRKSKKTRKSRKSRRAH